MKLVRFLVALPLALLLIARGTVQAVGTALLLLAGAMLGLVRALLWPDRFRRRQIVEALLRATLRPLPLVGALTALLGTIFALAIGYFFAIAQVEELLLAAMRQSLMRQAVPLLIGLLVLGEAGLGLAARLSTMEANGEADTLRSLDAPPIDWVLPPALLEFAVMGAVQFLCGTAIAHLTAALVLQAQLGVPPGHYADMLVGPAARADFWGGAARSEASALFSWMTAAATGIAVAPGPDHVVRAVRTTFIITLLGLLAITALFTWVGA